MSDLGSTDLFALTMGGALGALCRGVILGWRSRAMSSVAASPLPWDGPAQATALSNSLGCLLLGLWLGSSAGLEADIPLALDVFAIAGFCGGLSTFSSLCADWSRLMHTGRPAGAAGYLAATLVLGGAGLILGWGFGS